MHFNIIHASFLSEPARAMCLAFMHSLWQGLIAAVLAGGFLMLTRKSRPAFRYNVLAFLLGMLLITNVATCLLLLSPQNASEMTGTAFISRSEIWQTGMAATGGSGSYPELFLQHITRFCGEHAFTIVAVWLVVFLWKSMRAAAGLWHLSTIRSRGIQVPSADWLDVFADLTRKLGMHGRISLFESGQVHVPMVIGYMKPVVLVPLGMLAGMPAAQVEAILLHELAHIRRRDYLVNLVQVFCENIYFFNPAVLWLSALIRQEREHCCDEMAIEVSGNRGSFVHALVSFQEYKSTGLAAEVAFFKKKNHLLHRIKRIINHNNKSLDAMEKVFVSASLIAAVALSAAISPQPVKSTRSSAVSDHQRIYSLETVPVSSVSNVPADTLPKTKKDAAVTKIHSADVYTPSEGVATYNVHMDGKQYDIVRKNGKIISLDVDGREIPASEYEKYSDVLARIEKNVKEAHEQAEKERTEAEHRREEAGEQRREADNQRLEAAKSRAEADERKQEATIMRVQAEQVRLNAEQMRKQADVMREQAGQMRQEAEKMRVEAEKSREQAAEMRKEAEKTREEFEKKQAALIEDLLKNGIIKDTKQLSYLLSEEEFVVNGASQPEEIRKRFSSKYLSNPTGEMVYNYKGRTGYTSRGTVRTR
ncbi:M56 family metallopeptidase [Dyadobacter sandarakinus]|uniref:Peptidase M56 BlaR1 n=1 Tax=Dyadobacter sandarakinus TaxID=2747268 RepID=A0ABX7I0V0_9BACT|nr:M56 family metallopeptidase [Dyadobacter sandarakinus]QRQ99671.1 peptidase M56 BlaR1 [Dyadobacter sandarakinus]